MSEKIKNSAQSRAFLELHVAVFLWGFTAILGTLIQLNSLNLVWWRTFLTALVYLIFTKVFQEVRQLPRSVLLRFMGIGILLTVHWVCFYGAIKLANASVALICMGTTALFSAFLEPLLNRTRMRPYEIFLGVLMIPGILLIKNQTDKAGDNMALGFWLGILSAVVITFVSIFNKKNIATASPLSISFLQMVSGFLFLTLLMPFILWQQKMPLSSCLPSQTDWIYLAILVVVCTNISTILCFRAMKHLSAFATNLTINLEPIYGILLAIPILGEHRQLSLNFYIGCAIILGAVSLYPVLRTRFEKF
jgi:drug/metabolite transporter (DMT)-like permease